MAGHSEEAIRTFIDNEVVKAKKWCEANPEKCEGLSYGSGKGEVMWAIVAILVVYMALYYTKPQFVMTEVKPADGGPAVMQLDMVRAWLLSVVAGVVVYAAL
jgi:hypothetical protein